ncbi:MAG: HK97 gp10 family phage protein [Treponema sp.]|nr:HK97 gp10 family phage protein [Treponema sp.]
MKGSIEAVFDTKAFNNKLSLFSSGLGNIYNELLAEIAKPVIKEAKSKAPVRTGKLRDHIKFIFLKKDATAMLTTMKRYGTFGAWYSNIREHGANIEAKKEPYLVFKINGEWKKVAAVKTPAQPFGKPVFNEYFDEHGKAWPLLQEALLNKMKEAGIGT